MSLTLLHTNTSNTKSSPAINNFVGVSVWVKDTDGSFLYFPIKDDGTETKPSTEAISGYTYSHIELKSINTFLSCDSQINLPTYGYLTVSEIINHVDFGSKIYASQIYENGKLLGLEKILVYSVIPTGKCLNKTLKYTNTPIIFKEDGITPLTQEDGVSWIIDETYYL